MAAGKATGTRLEGMQTASRRERGTLFATPVPICLDGRTGHLASMMFALVPHFRGGVVPAMPSTLRPSFYTSSLFLGRCCPISSLVMGGQLGFDTCANTVSKIWWEAGGKHLARPFSVSGLICGARLTYVMLLSCAGASRLDDSE
jgi:hypothetical protein